MEAIEPEHNEHEGMDEASIREHEEVTKVKVSYLLSMSLCWKSWTIPYFNSHLQNVNYVELGRYRMEAWYFSPFPKEYWPNGLIDTVCVVNGVWLLLFFAPSEAQDIMTSFTVIC